jgi:glycogenin glucosyltransferase
MILKPDKKIFEELVKMKDIIETPKDPSDQGLLNHYFFKKWFRLKPIYNFTRRVFDVAPIKWRELRNEICVIHYTLEKPWKKREDTEINKLWWEINDSANILS